VEDKPNIRAAVPASRNGRQSRCSPKVTQGARPNRRRPRACRCGAQARDEKVPVRCLDLLRRVQLRVEDAGQGGSLDFEEVSSQFDEVSRFTTSELGYVFQVERHEGRVAGHDDAVVTALRATLVFRREDGVWKIAHRHADPIMSTRPATTLLQS
jgi:SnoaL-like domain